MLGARAARASSRRRWPEDAARPPPASIIATETSCGWVSPSATSVVAAQELDQEALEARADQVDARTACPGASGRASATAASAKPPITIVS